jgi:hypothetical protein
LRRTAAAFFLRQGVEQPQAQISLGKKVWDLWQFGDKGAFAALFADDFVNVDAHGFSTESENVKGNRQSHQTRIPLWEFDVRRIGPDVVLILGSLIKAGIVGSL